MGTNSARAAHEAACALPVVLDEALRATRARGAGPAVANRLRFPCPPAPQRAIACRWSVVAPAAPGPCMPGALSRIARRRVTPLKPVMLLARASRAARAGVQPRPRAPPRRVIGRDGEASAAEASDGERASAVEKSRPRARRRLPPACAAGTAPASCAHRVAIAGNRRQRKPVAFSARRPASAPRPLRRLRRAACTSAAAFSAGAFTSTRRITWSRTRASEPRRRRPRPSSAASRASASRPPIARSATRRRGGDRHVPPRQRLFAKSATAVGAAPSLAIDRPLRRRAHWRGRLRCHCSSAAVSARFSSVSHVSSS